MKNITEITKYIQDNAKSIDEVETYTFKNTLSFKYYYSKKLSIHYEKPVFIVKLILNTVIVKEPVYSFLKLNPKFLGINENFLLFLDF